MKNNIPNISMGEYGYEGQIHLSAWDDYLTDLNGTYGLDIGGDMVDDNPTILNEHVAAYHFTIENQDKIRDSVINALFQSYTKRQNEYGYDAEEADEIMPDVANPEGFQDLIGLSKVHIMNVYKDGIAYIGYEFTCTWDEEHGFGVMMHKDRIVEIGGADTSILTWIAEKDLEN